MEVEETRELLKAIWTDPLALDPSRRSARVTREVADRLAKLAKSMEGKHDAETVAQFLMRCLFTMFAEDVEIGGFQRDDFTNLLRDCRENLESFVPMMETLWSDMDTGRFSGLLKRKIKQFNGGLFEEQKALPVNEDQLELLIEAAEAEWNDVEPAIFGTLLERALDPVERHKLGAHYTPRAYVERLVMPTIMEPLREQWDTIYATAVAYSEEGKDAEARKTVRQFHEQLCEARILDPACGSGNFLYVLLELMKRLEGEVLKALRAFGEKQLPLLTVDPHQFLGIEVNPRAAAITDLVLWIGYLQWHFRARGNDPLNEPIIRKFHNIECRDAVLDWDAIEPVVDEEGNPVIRWDGRTTKPHPVTGEEVPDETARVQELKYINPRKAEWPEADYIVGNPPFIGNKKMRLALGDGYVEAIRNVQESVSDTADFVMYWWSNASQMLPQTITKRFGFITTNSITLTSNRKVVSDAISKCGISITFGIPDHPWVDSGSGAAVRVAMTVAQEGSELEGVLFCLPKDLDSRLSTNIIPNFSKSGIINPDLSLGVNLRSVNSLLSNNDIAFTGMYPLGQGFVILPGEEIIDKTPEQERKFLKQFFIARDLGQKSRNALIIDFTDLTKTDATKIAPSLFQHVLDHVKPQRDHDKVKKHREEWWLFARTRPELRKALTGIERFLLVPRTSRHFTFRFFDINVIPDSSVVALALDDSFHQGVLSSRVHLTWAVAVGGRLGAGNDTRYQHIQTFDPFPFPDPDEPTKQRIRKFGEQLDAHRKRQQELHSDLTMTGMYNVLEKLRSGEALTDKEKKIHHDGLVSTLKQIHDDLDAAVFDAYGWSHDLSDEEILEKLVELNHERAEEEANGKIRWLRPEFQNPDGDGKQQKSLGIEADKPKKSKAKPTKAKVKKQPWPKTLPERITAVRAKLVEHGQPSDVAALSKYFTRANKDNLEEVLDTLVLVGQARVTDDGRYAA